MKLRFITPLLLCIFTFLILGSRVEAVDYYFDSVSGNDSNDCLTSSTACQSINLMQLTIQCNSAATINVKAGSEWDANNINTNNQTCPGGGGTLNFAPETEGLAIYQSGVTIQPYGSGSTPRFINPRIGGGSSTKVILVQGNNVTVDGIAIDDRATGSPAPTPGAGVITNTAYGIYMFTTSNSIVRNTNITRVGYGVYIEGDNNFVTNNTIHDTQMITNTPRATDSDDDKGAVGIVISGSTNEVSYNTLYNNRAIDYDYCYNLSDPNTCFDGGAIEFYANGTTVQSNYIHHNYAYNNEGFMEIGGAGGASAVNNNTISYNILLNNSRLFYFNLSGTFTTTIQGLELFHNDIADTTTSGYGYYIAFSSQPASGTLTMRNNIFYFHNSLTVSQTMNTSGALTHTDNVYYEYNGTTDNSSLGFTADASEVLANPLFTDTTFDSESDFILQVGSPAINTGGTLATSENQVTRYTGTTTTVQSIDYAGTSVPQSTAPEIGAYESTAVTPTPSPTSTATPTPTSTLTPTPTSTSSSSSSSGSSGGSSGTTGTSGPFQCSATIPSAPNLFQITQTDTSASLSFSPVSNASSYVIAYGYSEGEERFGATFSPQNNNGVISYTIRDLNPNTTYYFKVRAQNGCAPGPWSNNKSAAIKPQLANASAQIWSQTGFGIAVILIVALLYLGDKRVIRKLNYTPLPHSLLKKVRRN